MDRIRPHSEGKHIHHEHGWKLIYKIDLLGFGGNQIISIEETKRMREMTQMSKWGKLAMVAIS